VDGVADVHRHEGGDRADRESPPAVEHVRGGDIHRRRQQQDPAPIGREGQRHQAQRHQQQATPRERQVAQRQRGKEPERAEGGDDKATLRDRVAGTGTSEGTAIR